MKTKGFSFLDGLGYARHVFRRERIRRILTILICAAAVSFAALCSGYLGQYEAAQTEYIRNISDRQLIVYNNVCFGNYLIGDNPGIDPSLVQQFGQIEGVERVSPVLLFVSSHQVSAGVDQYSDLSRFSEEEEREANLMRMEMKDRKGNVVRTTDADPEIYRAVQSFSIDNYYDPRCFVIDETVRDGAYLSSSFAEMLELTEKDLNGLTLCFEVWVPTAEIECPRWYSDGRYINGQWVEEKEWRRGYNPFYTKTSITTKIRGICDSELLNNPYLTSQVYLPVSLMEQVLEETIEEIDDPELSNAKKTAEWLESLSDAPPEVAGYEVSPWNPQAYEITVTDLTVLPQVRQALSELSPDFDFVQEYQDISAGIQYLNNTRKTMLYIAGTILTVVFLLTALVYVGLIDRRKYEFAVLRANGLTKREVRKIVWSEMLLQAVAIALAGAVFTVVIYLIAGKGLGYPFELSWAVFLWLVVISFGAVILPTILSLLFVNRYEPDRVIRR